MALFLTVFATLFSLMSITLVSAQTVSSTTPSCVTLTYSMGYGSRDFFTNGDVSRLQTFLNERGYLSVGATGFYGRLTAAAVANFQGDNGIIRIGLIGPFTRARILAVSCGATPPPPSTNVPTEAYLSPKSGAVGDIVTIHGSGFTRDNTVHFDYGVILHIASSDGTTLVFIVPSALNAACYYSSPACLMASREVILGNYEVSVQNVNGTSNTQTFQVTSRDRTGTGAPTISGIDSPTTLGVGQTGTWTVRAIDQTGGGLSYSVVWGDENQSNYGYAMSPSSNTFVQSSTFTHSYSQVGVYNPTFTVQGSNGLTARTSTTVNVTYQSQPGNQTPSISSLSPVSGPYGTRVTITGSGFTQYNNSINFAGKTNVSTGVQSNDGRTLYFTIPTTPCSSGQYCSQIVIQPGTYAINVTNQNGTSNTLYFNVTSGQSMGTSSMTMYLGQTGSFGDLRVTPLSIVEDSRCPAGVYCIQAGRAVVQTHIVSPQSDFVVNMQVGSGQYVTTAEGYTVLATDIAPLRTQNQNIDYSQYQITYQVKRQ